MDEFDMCVEFHKVIADIPLMGWQDIGKIPEEPGLYCAYEDGEACTGHASDNKRIVYIGANTRGSTIKSRIERHYVGRASKLWTHIAQALYMRGDLEDLIQFQSIEEMRKCLTSMSINKHPESEHVRDLVSNYMKHP